MSFTETLVRARRRAVRRVGRRFIKRVADVVARQGLVADRPVHDVGHYPFIAGFEADWEKIRAEVDALLLHRAHLPAFHEISPDQYKISHGDRWKVFILFGFGVPSERNCARCPETARLLRGVPGLQTAMFSILSPRYHIPRHRGVSKTMLRVHLALHVPSEGEKCRMQVGDETFHWEPGRCVVFDDYYRHEVWNDTDEERVVLIFDFVRPMRPLGRLINAGLVWGIKRTAYFKDGERNLKSWDERLEAAVRNAEAIFEEAQPQE